MSSSIKTSLISRITYMLWVGNAIGCAFVALYGALMCFGLFGYDADLSALTMRIGALLAAAGAMVMVYSLWKARSLSASRN